VVALLWEFWCGAAGGHLAGVAAAAWRMPVRGCGLARSRPGRRGGAWCWRAGRAGLGGWGRAAC